MAAGNNMDQACRALELKLFRFIGENIQRNRFEAFKYSLRQFLSVRDLDNNDSSVEELLLLCVTRGVISRGNYDNLIEVLRNAGLEGLIGGVEEIIEQIRRQMRIEKAVERMDMDGKYPGVPSEEPGNDDKPPPSYMS